MPRNSSLSEQVRTVNPDQIPNRMLSELVREVQTKSSDEVRQGAQHWSDNTWKQWRQHSSHNPW